MSALGEISLIQHLVDPESVETLAQDGLQAEVIPSEALRKIYEFAVDYFHQSGRIKAPSIAVLRAEFGDVLDEHEIDMEHEPDESIEWAIDDLKGSFAHREGQEFLRSTAIAISEADTAGKVQTLSEAADGLMQITFKLEDRSSRIDARDSSERMHAYRERAQNRELVRGMRFGLNEIDTFTRGIHPGELAVLAAPPKAGKSFLALKAAYAEWQSGKNVVLFTLENSVEMSLDRMVCAAVGASSRGWQHGDANPEHVEAIERKIVEFADAEHPMWILQPDLGQRSIPYMIREGMLRGADAIVIDQLTFVEMADPRKAKHERIGDSLHTLKGMISTGRDRVPVLLVHQINRDGVLAARKDGRLRMEHMAESAEVERTADWVFGLFQTESQRQVQEITFQVLAARRERIHAWNLAWEMNTGHTRVIGDANLDE